MYLQFQPIFLVEDRLAWPARNIVEKKAKDGI
jgi:hypothetical protein